MGDAPIYSESDELLDNEPPLFMNNNPLLVNEEKQQNIKTKTTKITVNGDSYNKPLPKNPNLRKQSQPKSTNGQYKQKQAAIQKRKSLQNGQHYARNVPIKVRKSKSRLPGLGSHSKSAPKIW